MPTPSRGHGTQMRCRRGSCSTISVVNYRSSRLRRRHDFWLAGWDGSIQSSNSVSAGPLARKVVGAATRCVCTLAATALRGGCLAERSRMVESGPRITRYLAWRSHPHRLLHIELDAVVQSQESRFFRQPPLPDQLENLSVGPVRDESLFHRRSTFRASGVCHLSPQNRNQSCAAGHFSVTRGFALICVPSLLGH
jgi:hypothetical protein